MGKPECEYTAGSCSMMTCQDSVSGSLKRLWRTDGEQWQLSCKILSDDIASMVDMEDGVITQRHGLDNNFVWVVTWML